MTRTYPGVLKMVEDTKANLNSNYELIEVVPGNSPSRRPRGRLNATGIRTPDPASHSGRIAGRRLDR